MQVIILIIGKLLQYLLMEWKVPCLLFLMGMWGHVYCGEKGLRDSLFNFSGPNGYPFPSQLSVVSTAQVNSNCGPAESIFRCIKTKCGIGQNLAFSHWKKKKTIHEHNPIFPNQPHQEHTLLQNHLEIGTIWLMGKAKVPVFLPSLTDNHNHNSSLEWTKYFRTFNYSKPVAQTQEKCPNFRTSKFYFLDFSKQRPPC